MEEKKEFKDEFLFFLGMIFWWIILFFDLRSFSISYNRFVTVALVVGGAIPVIIFVIAFNSLTLLFALAISFGVYILFGILANILSKKIRGYGFLEEDSRP
ncbi:MAG: hypothetical protein ACD_15C00054G0002 [uncultured bacterium]|nr:MAG: hypothetical protein ACD_15C00054G0002 [uncultured bacterium]